MATISPRFLVWTWLRALALTERVAERQPKKPKRAGKAAGEMLEKSKPRGKRLRKALRSKTSTAS